MQMEYGAGICNKFPQGGLAIAVTAIAVEYDNANLCTKMTWFKIHVVSNTNRIPRIVVNHQTQLAVSVDVGSGIGNIVT